MIVDGENLILGRVVSRVAKKALQGEKVDIVNCEKILITGRKDFIIAKYKHRAERGEPFHGPFYPRTPIGLVKRIIRGMLPYKQEKGLSAFKRIKCYVGIPKGMEKTETIKEASIEKLNTLRFMSIGDLCRSLKK